MKAKDIEKSLSECSESAKLKSQIEVLREALDKIYTEAQKHAGEYPGFNAKVANQALLSTESYCLNHSTAKGYLIGFKDGYEQCSADEDSGDWTDNDDQLTQYAEMKASDFLSKNME